MSEKITVRSATAADLDDAMRVEREAWPHELQASREKLESRLQVFPQGFCVAFLDDTMAGVSTSERVHHDGAQHAPTWHGVTDDGWIRETHHAEGNALYVVSLGVSLPGQGIGSRLMEAQKGLVRRLGLDCLILGARCPDYHREDYDGVPADRYIMLTRPDGQLADREIRFYSRCGLRPVRAMPEYMGRNADRESRDLGVIMVWDNPAAGRRREPTGGVASQRAE